MNKKIINKKLLSIGSILAIGAPIATVVACGSTSSSGIRTDLRKHEYLVSKDIQDSTSRVHTRITSVRRHEINDLSPTLLGLYNAKMVASGYGEKRQFYSENTNNVTIHNGVDVFLNKNEKVLAPSGAEIINAFWENTPSKFAAGVGGVVTLRLKISELNIEDNLKEYIYVKSGRGTHPKYFRVPKFTFSHNGEYHFPNYKDGFNIDDLSLANKSEYDAYINGLSESKKEIATSDSEYVYIQYMHLSKSTIDHISNDVKIGHTTTREGQAWERHIPGDIDWNHPKAVAKGSVVGFVGSMHENGGWHSHVHVNAYSVLSNRNTRWRRIDITHEMDDRYLSRIRGTIGSNGFASGPKWASDYDIVNIINLQHDGNFDPNEIFDFYQSDDTIKVPTV